MLSGKWLIKVPSITLSRGWKPNASDAAEPDMSDSGLALGANCSPTPLRQFSVKWGGNIQRAQWHLGKKEAQCLAQYFSQDYSLHLDIWLCLMSVSPGRGIQDPYITQGPSLSIRTITQPS